MEKDGEVEGDGKVEGDGDGDGDAEKDGGSRRGKHKGGDAQTTAIGTHASFSANRRYVRSSVTMLNSNFPSKYPAMLRERFRRHADRECLHEDERRGMAA